MSLRNFGITAALLLTGALAANSAHAGPNVQWQVSVETPVIRLGHVSLPLPPILVPRAVSVGPQYDGRDYRGYRSEPRRWDADGDGVPNRYDPVYNPRWDRDGDGVPNRYDAYPYDPRNGRGWHGHEGWRRDDHRRDERRDERREERRDWRDDHHRR